MLYIVIDVFIGGPLENQLVEGQPSLKELNMKIYIYENTVTSHHRFTAYQSRRTDLWGSREGILLF